MHYHDHGHLKDKVTVDSGTDAAIASSVSYTQQREFVKRMGEPKFAEAVRLAARHDPVIKGGETELERLHRHQLSPTVGDRGIIEGHKAASRVIGVKSRIITV